MTVSVSGSPRCNVSRATGSRVHPHIAKTMCAIAYYIPSNAKILSHRKLIVLMSSSRVRRNLHQSHYPTLTPGALRLKLLYPSTACSQGKAVGKEGQLPHYRHYGCDCCLRLLPALRQRISFQHEESSQIESLRAVVAIHLTIKPVKWKSRCNGAPNSFNTEKLHQHPRTSHTGGGVTRINDMTGGHHHPLG
jgi:hypothetical protein